MPSKNEWVALGALSLVLLVGLSRGSMGSDFDAEPFLKWDGLFKRYGTRYNVPWRWLKAICMNESSLGEHPSVARGLEDPSDVDGSKSDDGLSWGLMQLTLRTARALEGAQIDAVFLNNPDNSVRLGAELVSELILKYGIEDRESIIRDYNGGPKKGPMTIVYYARFMRNLSQVLDRQPGNELEGYQG